MSRVIVIRDDQGMSRDDKLFLQSVFKGEVDGKAPCEWCGGLHESKCRRVKRLVMHPSGERVSEIEFWPDGQWDKTNIVWPEDVFDE